MTRFYNCESLLCSLLGFFFHLSKLKRVVGGGKESFLRTSFDRNGTCDQLAEANGTNSKERFCWVLKQKEESGSFSFFLFIKLTKL